MASNYKVVTTWARKSGILKDYVDFDFHVQPLSGADMTAGEWANVNSDISNFINTLAVGQTNAVFQYLSNVLKRTAASITTQAFKLPAAPGPTGVAVFSGTISPAGGGGGNDLPAELAICLSFHGDYTLIPEHGAGGTRPKARWRNRVFLGPITDFGTTPDGTTSEILISSQCRTDLTKAAGKLQTALAGHGVNWVTWSPTDWAAHPVVGGWVDNAVDVQRRRGIAATAKTTF